MNIRDLEYLVAVDDLEHFGKAAERCHVTQPTLSGQIKKLETHLGIQLVERTNRKVMMTKAGHEIAQRARKVLAQVEDIEILAASYGEPMSGKVRLGVIPTLAPYLLPLIITPLKQKWPSLELLLHEGQTHELLERLTRGDLDAALLALPVEGDFGARPLGDEDFFLAVPRNHELAQREFAETSDLENRSVLLLEDGHCLRDQALDVCFTAGAYESGNFRATSLETLRHMVAAGSGMTLVPEMAVMMDLQREHGTVRYLPFKKPAPCRRLGLIYRNNSGRSECFRNIGGFINDVLDESLSRK